MGLNHSHHTEQHQSSRALTIALLLTASFLIIEVVGGLLTNSLALLSDAAHMFTDVAALVVALAANQIAKQPANSKKTFGYYRFEILAATFNAILLFIVAIYILYEAYLRLKAPPEIQSMGMFVIAVMGLGINFASMRVLQASKDQGLNLKTAYLEVWSDMLGSCGVIVAALILYWKGWVWVDSVVAVAIGIWILPRTWSLLRESLNILLEGVPDGIQIADIEQAITNVPGVRSVHDLHVWALTSGKISLTAHVVYDPPQISEAEVIHCLQTVLSKRFSVMHTTFQCEVTPCQHADNGCNL